MSADAPNSRQALIDAARDLFAKHAFAQVSTKDIAAAAGVNPAMIHYHFQDKSGLLKAAFREAVAPVLEEVTRLLMAEAGQAFPLRRFLQIYMGTLAANPWLPQMIVRHVLPEGGPLQKLVVAELASRMGPAVAALVARGQAQKALRPDLDPVLTTLSIVSLAIFPFLSLPVTRRVFDLKVDAEFVEQLIGHTAALFFHGAETTPVGHPGHGT
ncbi:MAG TPA: TetR/AcrR family transcriptional regulator [Gammaproteobacteria bacterium]|nr:TetR/AcrR family transcriptional regulator [Gammaproteobacteria bacterium]